MYHAMCARWRTYCGPCRTRTARTHRGRVTEVLPIPRSIFVERLDSLGPVQEALGQFVAARQLLSGHPVEVQCCIRGERESTDQDIGNGF